MSRIYDMIKGLLPKNVSANSGNSDEQPQRSEEELETICESKSLLQKMEDSIREIWLLCMEPFM
ncbi:hypothetical protein [Prevotella sp.]|uniref:hypothetical protein n=1 Tax=Prevotella sp. TaxID=59823 RepID=UPI0040265D0D